ncbi:unnamed protein product [Amoebophrya sp. A120]|nr:unnamed protein product [Amoebophrya sp. A120]|eukprot:GSA120T00008510001.1
MVTPGQMQMFNKPEAYETQILGSKYKNQYEYDPSQEIPNAGVYKLRLHDHTLGNALRMELLKSKKVLFAGYRVPHPLFHEIEVRIHTTQDSTPQEELLHAIGNLENQADSLLQQFDSELDRWEAGKQFDKRGFPERQETVSGNKNVVEGLYEKNLLTPAKKDQMEM